MARRVGIWGGSILFVPAFWLGIGFQDQAIFHDHIPLWARAILDNRMTSGGLCAILLTFLVGLRHLCRSVEHQLFRSGDHLTLRITGRSP